MSDSHLRGPDWWSPDRKWEPAPFERRRAWALLTLAVLLVGGIVVAVKLA